MATTDIASIKSKLLQLMANKDNLELQINTYGDILAKNNNIGLHGSLLDAEGYPRNDIDVYQVRQARQQIICLQNDHKYLMREIEHLLHQLHSESKHDVISSETLSLNENKTSVDNANTSSLKSIVIINHVAPGSPAEEAGLCNGDSIVRFGTINCNNFDNNLESINNLVKHMVNQRIQIKVIRNAYILDLVLIPKKWSGRGLLGCNITLNKD